MDLWMNRIDIAFSYSGTLLDLGESLLEWKALKKHENCADDKCVIRGGLSVGLCTERFNGSDRAIMILYTIALVFIMGPRCSTLPPSEMIGIVGNGNSAIIINGVSYNISSILTTAADVMLKKYRFGWVFLAFSLVLLTLISAVLLILLLLLRGHGINRKTIACN